MKHNNEIFEEAVAAENVAPTTPKFDVYLFIPMLILTYICTANFTTANASTRMVTDLVRDSKASDRIKLQLLARAGNFAMAMLSMYLNYLALEEYRGIQASDEYAENSYAPLAPICKAIGRQLVLFTITATSYTKLKDLCKEAQVPQEKPVQLDADAKFPMRPLSAANQRQRYIDRVAHLR